MREAYVSTWVPRYRTKAQIAVSRSYAKSMGVDEETVILSGGVDKLQSLSPEVQRLLLGISEKVSA